MKNPGTEALRIAIRELLAEEMARLRGEQRGAASNAREEQVSLRDDAELAAFVRRLGALYADPAARAQIEAGRHRFRLAAAAPARAAADTALAEIRLLTEREVNALGTGTTRLQVGKHTRVTPLARDALRRRGITLSRSES